jgi:D-alanyl-D-alanine dipeptidase
MKKIKYTVFVLLLISSLIWVLYVPILKMYCQYRNALQLQDIKGVNPEAYATFESFIKAIEAETDWQVMIVSGYRDEEKQAILKKMNPKNASPGKSKHNFGKAIDICVFQSSNFSTKWLVKSSSKQAWEASQITAIAAQFKLNWGGDFSHYHDPVHFEVH